MSWMKHVHIHLFLGHSNMIQYVVPKSVLLDAPRVVIQVEVHCDK